jgi:hypothetical protein
MGFAVMKGQASKDQRASIADHVGQADLASDPVWSKLDELSSHTEFEGIEVFPDEIEMVGDQFRGFMNVYVTLNYGKKADAFSRSDGFPGVFRGRLVDGRIEDLQFDVDTSSFYA